MALLKSSFARRVACLQHSSSTVVLLTKNEIRAVQKLVFTVVQKMSIQKMKTDFHSCGVDLSSVLVWAIREQRLYSSDADTMEFNVKLDGRPLGGMMTKLHHYQERSVHILMYTHAYS